MTKRETWHVSKKHNLVEPRNTAGMTNNAFPTFAHFVSGLPGQEQNRLSTHPLILYIVPFRGLFA